MDLELEVDKRRRVEEELEYLSTAAISENQVICLFHGHNFQFYQ